MAPKRKHSGVEGATHSSRPPGEGRRGSGKQQAVRLAMGLLAAMSLIGVSTAHGKKKPKAAPPPAPADLPGHVNYLARQLYYLPLDESEPITSQIQKLVVDHLAEWLPGRMISGSPVALDVQVRQELENAFAQLHFPLFGQPAVFVQPWKDGQLIGAGYTLGWNEYDRANVLALFESREGKTQLAAVTNFVPRIDLHYEFLPPQAENFRFMVYGTRAGKSQPRLTAILYEFDGQTLKSLWQIQDVFDGRMDVGKDKIVIRYLKEEEYVHETAHRRRPPRHEAVYRITPRGLELESDHEIAF